MLDSFYWMDLWHYLPSFYCLVLRTWFTWRSYKTSKKVSKQGRMQVTQHLSKGQFHQHSGGSFCACRSRKRKNDSQVDSLFLALFWSKGVKSVHSALMQLSPGGTLIALSVHSNNLWHSGVNNLCFFFLNFFWK